MAQPPDKLKIIGIKLSISCQKYFWRTFDRKEVDYAEEYDDRLDGYEFKWRKGKVVAPKEFLAYKNSLVCLVNRDDYQDFLMK